MLNVQVMNEDEEYLNTDCYESCLTWLLQILTSLIIRRSIITLFELGY